MPASSPALVRSASKSSSESSPTIWCASRSCTDWVEVVLGTVVFTLSSEKTEGTLEVMPEGSDEYWSRRIDSRYLGHYATRVLLSASPRVLVTDPVATLASYIDVPFAITSRAHYIKVALV